MASFISAGSGYQSNRVMGLRIPHRTAAVALDANPLSEVYHLQTAGHEIFVVIEHPATLLASIDARPTYPRIRGGTEFPESAELLAGYCSAHCGFGGRHRSRLPLRRSAGSRESIRDVPLASRRRVAPDGPDLGSRREFCFLAMNHVIDLVTMTGGGREIRV